MLSVAPIAAKIRWGLYSPCEVPTYVFTETQKIPSDTCSFCSFPTRFGSGSVAQTTLGNPLAELSKSLVLLRRSYFHQIHHPAVAWHSQAVRSNLFC